MKALSRIVALGLAVWGLVTILRGQGRFRPASTAAENLDSAASRAAERSQQIAGLAADNDNPEAAAQAKKMKQAQGSSKASSPDAVAAGGDEALTEEQNDADLIDENGGEPSKLTGANAERLNFMHGPGVTASGLKKLARDRLAQTPFKQSPQVFVTAPFVIRNVRARFGFAIDVSNRFYANRICLRDESQGPQPVNATYTNVPQQFGVVADKLRVGLPRTNAEVEDVRFNRFVLEFPLNLVSQGQAGTAQLYQLKRSSEQAPWTWDKLRSAAFWPVEDELTRLSETFKCNWSSLQTP